MMEFRQCLLEKFGTVEGHVAMLKFNPINDYMGPYVEHAFSDLISAGFVRTSYGGASVGDHLVRHPEVDEVHITGSESSLSMSEFEHPPANKSIELSAMGQTNPIGQRRKMLLASGTAGPTCLR